MEKSNTSCLRIVAHFTGILSSTKDLLKSKTFMSILLKTKSTSCSIFLTSSIMNAKKTMDGASLGARVANRGALAPPSASRTRSRVGCNTSGRCKIGYNPYSPSKITYDSQRRVSFFHEFQQLGDKEAMCD
jgi:hypothetical protein